MSKSNIEKDTKDKKQTSSRPKEELVDKTSSSYAYFSKLAALETSQSYVDAWVEKSAHTDDIDDEDQEVDEWDCSPQNDSEDEPLDDHKLSTQVKLTTHEDALLSLGKEAVSFSKRTIKEGVLDVEAEDESEYQEINLAVDAQIRNQRDQCKTLALKSIPKNSLELNSARLHYGIALSKISKQGNCHEQCALIIDYFSQLKSFTGEIGIYQLKKKDKLIDHVVAIVRWNNALIVCDPWAVSEKNRLYLYSDASFHLHNAHSATDLDKLPLYTLSDLKKWREEHVSLVYKTDNDISGLKEAKEKSSMTEKTEKFQTKDTSDVDLLIKSLALAKIIKQPTKDLEPSLQEKDTILKEKTETLSDKVSYSS